MGTAGRERGSPIADNVGFRSHAFVQMQALELKIPPPAVALVLVLAMWWVARHTPVLALDGDARVPLRLILALCIGLPGLVCDLGSAWLFHRAHTTVNPMRPGNTSALVTGGLFRYTRNPMYVGFVLMLTGWAVYLAAPWSLAGPLAFAAYMTRFQIIPEERLMRARFGAQYEAYCARVRRWL